MGSLYLPSPGTFDTRRGDSDTSSLGMRHFHPLPFLTLATRAISPRDRPDTCGRGRRGQPQRRDGRAPAGRVRVSGVSALLYLSPVKGSLGHP